MDQGYQLSLDDMEKQIIVQSQPNRTAYIDECGSFGFDFTTEGASKYYILCAVVVEETKDAKTGHEPGLESNGLESKEDK